LSEFSLELQNRKCILYKAQTEIKRNLNVLECQIERPGKFYSDAQRASIEKTFLGITLKLSKIPVIHRKQFLRGLINTMKSRLRAVTAILKEKCETLIKLSRYLDVDEWPEGINFTYGDSEIEELAEQFGLSGRQCVRTHREVRLLDRVII
jgi:hypothetical protein